MEKNSMYRLESYASERKMTVTREWMRGWNACLDEIDRNGGFTRTSKGDA
jgi:hypothetical protein